MTAYQLTQESNITRVVFGTREAKPRWPGRESGRDRSAHTPAFAPSFVRLVFLCAFPSFAYFMAVAAAAAAVSASSGVAVSECAFAYLPSP